MIKFTDFLTIGYMSYSPPKQVYTQARGFRGFIPGSLVFLRAILTFFDKKIKFFIRVSGSARAKIFALCLALRYEQKLY